MTTMMPSTSTASSISEAHQHLQPASQPSSTSLSPSSPNPGSSASLLRPNQSAVSDDALSLHAEDFVDVLCGGCGLSISEDSADAGIIHFAAQLWHIDCFRCAKCHEKVSTDRDDILLLSDGHPICGQCNYSCQICGQPILEEAIMTGDESYHASCFTCRSCNSRIEELVFAKTSQGIYCMPCHNERVARSRRHADAKRKARSKEGASRKPKPMTTEQREASDAGPSAFTPSLPSQTSLASSMSAGQMEETLTPSRSQQMSASTSKSSQAASPSADGTEGSRQRSQQLMASSDSTLSISTRPLSPHPSNAQLPRLTSVDSMSGRSDTPQGSSPRRSPHRPQTQATRPATTESRIRSPNLGPTHASAPPDQHEHEHEHESPATSRSYNDIYGRRSSESDARDTTPLAAKMAASESAPSNMPRNRSETASEASPLTPTVRPLNTSKPPSSPLQRQYDREARTSSPSHHPTGLATLPVQQKALRSDSHFSTSSDAVSEELRNAPAAQVKRASRISFQEPEFVDRNIVASPSSQAREMPTAFSFYDTEFMNLIDSFGELNDKEELQLSSPMLDSSAFDGDSYAADTRTDSSPSLSGQRKGFAGEMTQIPSSSSDSSIKTIQARVRESMKHAQDGQVSMDTTFVESILRELEATKDKMKLLQNKHARLKRASQQAVQGISHARTEFENQVMARQEAEIEMLKLRKQLGEQAGKLSVLTKDEKHQERLARRSRDLKHSVEGLTRDLAKLTAERDLTTAEVAELIAMQDGRSPLMSSGEFSSQASDANSSSSLQSRLSMRLDSVKTKYRREIAELTEKRDQLLLEVEDLRQSRDVYLEESEALNERNEELNALLAKLTSRIDSFSPAEPQSRSQSRQGAPPSSYNSFTGPSSKGFGFGLGRTRNQHGSSLSLSSSRDGLPGQGHNSSTDSSDVTATSSRGGISLPPSAAAAARAEANAAAERANTTSSAQAAVVKKFKWMKPGAKSLPQAPQSGASGVTSPPVPPKSGQTSASSHVSQTHVQRDHSHEVVVREHLFQSFNVLRPTRCFACQKNMWGQSEVRCNLCGQVCHSKCLQNLSISCTQPYSRDEESGVESAAPSMFGRSLSVQAQSEGRDVPLIVVKCIQTVEAVGMDYEGIYRKSGGTSQLRVITQLFERGQRFDLQDTDRFNDISAVTSVLKNYFRELPEPLLTFELHDEFIECIEHGRSGGISGNGDVNGGVGGGSTNGQSSGNGDKDGRVSRMTSVVKKLPRAHQETLKTLIRHLSNIAQRSEENRMNARNLGVVFGPTLMRSHDVSREFSEMGQKSMTIEFLCEHYDDIFAA